MRRAFIYIVATFCIAICACKKSNNSPSLADNGSLLLGTWYLDSTVTLQTYSYTEIPATPNWDYYFNHSTDLEVQGSYNQFTSNGLMIRNRFYPYSGGGGTFDSSYFAL